MSKWERTRRYPTDRNSALENTLRRGQDIPKRSLTLRKQESYYSACEKNISSLRFRLLCLDSYRYIPKFGRAFVKHYGGNMT